MAGIDKTYVSSWEEVQEVKEWASSIGTVIDDFGNTLNPMWWVPDWDEEYFNKWKSSIQKENERYKTIEAFEKRDSYYKNIVTYNEWCKVVDSWVEIPLWNTPMYFDIWLIRNCPINFIQERLKVQYFTDYENIKNKCSEYDTYKREVGTHFTIKPYKHNERFKDDSLIWRISVYDMWYNEETDSWRHSHLEPGPWTTDICHYKGNLNKKKISRMIKKWKLPIGAEMHFNSTYGIYCINNFNVIIKK